MTTTTTAPPPVSAPAPAPVAKPPPRPLQLRHIDTSTSASTSTSPPPSSSSQSPPQTAPLPGRRQPSRRQSSISYLPPDSARQWSVRSPVSPGAGLGRSASMSQSQAQAASMQAARYKRRSTGSSGPGPTNPSAPLTLAEKHADLLHFIAQKESKCLELRAQLAAHEAELLTLKRSWERIVHRDFGRAHPGAAFAAPPAAPVATNVPPTTLDGLVGVGKMLAAGLSSGAASTAPANANGNANGNVGSLAARPSPFAKRTPGVTSGHRSESSTSTSTTTGTGVSAGTRLSQSSASSLGLSDDAGGLGIVIAEELEATGLGGRAKSLRRRSGEVKAKAGAAAAQREAEREREREKAKEREREREREKRNSSGAGMGSLAWVGTMGRKLEELREGETFTKSQKRASILLSDVSQSIFSVLSPQTPSFHTPALASPSPSRAPSMRTGLSASTSLMDDDGDDEEARGLGMALTPDSPAPKTPMSALQPTSKLNNNSIKSNTKLKSSAKAQQEAAEADDDDEWNW
ncbi:hypothetical protein DENSPDRAFT_839495 [Dentipellis sp. KUC8613]|nr:hypothetical protein DENSPDRAFT_839495 [Dentipellis sp. KUC8613]